MAKLLFSEEQHYTLWWVVVIWILALFAVLVPFLYGIDTQGVLNKSLGENSLNTEGWLITGIFLGFPILFIVLVMAQIRLKTKITTDGIWIAYPPKFKKWKMISPEEIKNYEIKTVRIIRLYGGYGILFRRKYGKAYILSGNTGLQLYLKNGGKLLIGTNKKQAIQYAMEKLIKREE